MSKLRGCIACPNRDEGGANVRILTGLWGVKNAVAHPCVKTGNTAGFTFEKNGKFEEAQPWMSCDDPQRR